MLIVRRMVIITLILSSLCIAGSIAYFWPEIENGKHCEEHKYTQKEKCSYYKPLTFIGIKVANTLNHNEGTVVGGATFLLACITFALVVFTRGLMIYTRKLWGATDNLVERSEESTKTIERAYVTMTHVDPGVIWDDKNAEIFEIKMKIKNHGRTPANISDVRIGARVLENGDLLPQPFNYNHGNRETIPNAFLVPDDHFYHPKTFPLRGENLEIKHGAKTLWVFGHVDYRDAFGVRHRSSYVRTYNHIVEDGIRNNLFPVFTTRYNYDRQRKKGDGNDWDET